ncbi:MAG: helix-turn-helix transcriptional regulator [Robiginitomaculum sp.]|nr:helix-turn-helix transcriptional regulator [Robiginitomaculum sp.]
MTSRNNANTVSDSSAMYGEIAECDGFAALENTLLDSVAKNIGAETSALLHFKRNQSGYDIGHNLAHGVGNKVHDQYVSKFHRDDPVIVNRQLENLPTKQGDAQTDVYRLSDVCDNRTLEKTEYYNDFLKPSGIRHVLALAIKPRTTNNNQLIIIGFHRPFGMPDFGKTAIQKAFSIIPIIGSTIARLTFKEDLAESKLSNENLRSVLKDTGYIILDEALQIHDMSDCVRANVYGDLPFLMQAISRSIGSLGRNKDQYISVNFTCTDADNVSLNEDINFEITRTTSAGGPARFVIKLGFVHSNIAINRCTKQFQWTLREGEIVASLAKGLTNTQIAQALMISVRTVENHLRSVYTKADVTSRTQLLRQLLNCSPAH